MKKRLGDTLVEVTLAVGIFSMVAVAVVSVVNGSTSDAQTALETTVAREEIDAQAEALRFIHDSYVAGSDMGTDASATRYTDLWRKITANANAPRPDILEYNPSDCRSLYDGSNKLVAQQKAFIINPRRMSSGDPIILSKNNPNIFQAASTYPRIVYNDSVESLLEDENANKNAQRVEGIYIVGVKDSNTTNVVADKTHSSAKSAYYDFYIRTCWYGPGAERPSTISTVIRLYDPDAI